jgi:hypothetical protein
MIATDTDTDVLQDLELPVPCQGMEHSKGTSGHDPDAPGAFMVLSPCCGYRLIQCAPRVERLKTYDIIKCHKCGMDRSASKYLFIPWEGF